MSIRIYFLLLIACLFVSCSDDDDEDVSVDIQLQLIYDGQPLAKGQEIDYPLGYPMYFTKYSMYMSDVAFKEYEEEDDDEQEDDDEYTLADVLFFDLLEDEDQSVVQFSGVVEGGEYESLTFNVGLPANLNARTPEEFTSPDPLANSGEYWVGWSSYIFHKIEGFADFDNDGEFDKIALHIGSNAAFLPSEIQKEIYIDEENALVQLQIDLKKQLQMTDGYFDFEETPQVHAEAALPKVIPLVENIPSAIE